MHVEAHLSVLLGALSVVWSPDRAAAYLDPGTGSILVQLLLGGVAGVLALGKLYWGRIRGLFPGAKTATAAERRDPCDE